MQHSRSNTVLNTRKLNVAETNLISHYCDREVRHSYMETGKFTAKCEQERVRVSLRENCVIQYTTKFSLKYSAIILVSVRSKHSTHIISNSRFGVAHSSNSNNLQNSHKFWALQQ